MKKEFVVKMNQDFRQLGCIEKGAPNTFDPLEGLGTAHDCLEHFPNDTGSIDDEFQAFGAMIWLRSETGFFNINGYGGIGIALARDFVDLWGHYKSGVPMKEGKKNKDEHSSIEDIIDNAKIEIKENFNVVDDELNNFFISATYFMQLGFNRAKKRYPDNWTTIQVFKEIEKRVDDILKDSELLENDEIHIQYTKEKVISVNHMNYIDLHPEEFND